MTDSKTINTINKYYTILENENPTDEEKFFIIHIGLELAKTILQDFGYTNARELANVLLAIEN